MAIGNNSTLNRINPYVPILRSTPASITDPAVGACTWASGNHVWKGINGTFIQNESANAKNSHIWISIGIEGAISFNTKKSVVKCPPGKPFAYNPNHTIANSINNEPTKV